MHVCVLAHTSRAERPSTIDRRRRQWNGAEAVRWQCFDTTTDRLATSNHALFVTMAPPTRIVYILAACCVLSINTQESNMFSSSIARRRLSLCMFIKIYTNTHALKPIRALPPSPVRQLTPIAHARRRDARHIHTQPPGYMGTSACVSACAYTYTYAGLRADVNRSIQSAPASRAVRYTHFNIVFSAPTRADARAPSGICVFFDRCAVFGASPDQLLCVGGLVLIGRELARCDCDEAVTTKRMCAHTHTYGFIAGN